MLVVMHVQIANYITRKCWASINIIVKFYIVDHVEKASFYTIVPPRASRPWTGFFLHTDSDYYMEILIEANIIVNYIAYQ